MKLCDHTPSPRYREHPIVNSSPGMSAMRRTVVLACCALIATTALVGNPAGASDEPRGTAAASTPPLRPMAAASVPFTNRTTGDGLGNNRVYGVYAEDDTVYAATGSGLSISTDGGATFTNRTTADGLGDNGVAGVYAEDDTVYAATYLGLSISSDGGANFTNRTTGDGLGDNNVYGVYAVGATVYADLPVIRSHWMLTAWVLPFRNLTLRCSRLCGVAPW